MKEKIFVLKGQSQYEVLRVASDEVAQGFAAMEDYDVEVLDLNLGYEQIYKAINTPAKCIFSFQAIGFTEEGDNGRSVFSKVGSPVIGWIVDHPLWHSNRVPFADETNMHLACIDESHVQYIEDLYGIKNASFLPHGGFEASEKKSFQEKTIDIFFPGSYTDPKKHYNETILDFREDIKAIADYAIKEIHKGSNETNENLLRSYLKEKGIKVDAEYFKQLMPGVMDEIDIYRRYLDREKVIETLLNAGYKVTVAGNGWENFDRKPKHKLEIIGENLDIQQVVEYIADSKVLLNLSTMYPFGSHERVFTAMLSKTICVSNESSYFKKRFADKESILF